ncbi:MAG: malto-oligosyltrehalose synthase [Cyanobacteria bacterium J06623_4]
MRIPIATYRLQFTPSFGFEQASDIADYLVQLGISDIYASPIFKARSGSQHGYDVVDQNQINPELGGQEKFESLIQKVRDRNLGWLQDIVPNHMAYDRQNPYLMDVFEHGEKSQYSGMFDIDWSHQAIPGQVLAPMLGDTYECCLERGELQLSYDLQGLGINYYSLRFPISLESYPDFFSQSIEKLDSESAQSLTAILTRLNESLPNLAGKPRAQAVREIKAQLRSHYESNHNIRSHIEQTLQTFNQPANDTAEFAPLNKLLKKQFYQLAFWKTAAETLNYRRFFTVNELICLNAQDPAVFEQTHKLIQQLVEENKITGLRVDHIDGLYDPLAYLKRLSEATKGTYTLVEKILEATETLPEQWPIQGTSGYEFLTCVNRVFCQAKNEAAFSDLYQQFTELPDDYEASFLQKKRLLADTDLAGDLKNLSDALQDIAAELKEGQQLAAEGLAIALKEVMICFAVYRAYVDNTGSSKADQSDIQQAIAQAKHHLPQQTNELDFIKKLLTHTDLSALPDTLQTQCLHFAMRVQQFTGPLMAKGIEDTLFYVYNRFVGLNEVGGAPGAFGLSVEAFHRYHQHKQAHWPHTLNASSTHDTKRSEDVRSRLAVLSEIPETWATQVNHWRELNADKKQSTHPHTSPTPTDEYFLYQTLVGAYPFDNSDDLSDFRERIKAYAIKAGREAKVNTNWISPDESYENAYTSFIDQLLTPSKNNTFLNSLQAFQQSIATYGIYTALSQQLIKIAAPGIPDFYQGSELWDLSLVDPDNRRPVDYSKRKQHIKEIATDWRVNPDELLQNLLKKAPNGRIKLFLTMRGLALRHHYQDLFATGSYVPLTVTGTHAECVIAFARMQGKQTVIAIAPRFFTSLSAADTLPCGTAIWQDTAVTLPSQSQAPWKNWLTGKEQPLPEKALIGELCEAFPVALLSNEKYHTTDA